MARLASCKIENHQMTNIRFKLEGGVKRLSSKLDNKS